MKLKKLFILLLIINTIGLFGVIFIIDQYNKSIKQLEKAYIMQQKSFLLADELRQSSDDLTRMARTYVVTGKEMFKKQFHMVLDIRNGKLPRPKEYNSIYWDFLTLEGSKPILDGKKISLREMMYEAGFPESELSMLVTSQDESDDLTYLETKAMNAVIGVFQDKNGKYTIRGKPDFKLAREIMHSDEYHKAKIAIMKPLDEFYKAFRARTQKHIDEANTKVKKLESYVGIAIFALMILVLFSLFIILSRIIHPLELLNNTMIQLSHNDMDTVIPTATHKDEVGEMIASVEVFKDNAIKLIESEQKNKLLLDLAGEGIFGLDAKGRFTFLNPTACDILGYASEELIGKNCYETINNIKKQNLTKNETLMLEHKKEKNFRRKNGDFFPVDYVSTPIYNEKGLLEGSVVVFSDITQRKKAEDRLKLAIKEAKAANHSKSVFLANMSHELRTPLNAILGFAGLLNKSSHINGQEKENLKTIQSSGKHLLSLINEILELSKIEAGKIEISEKDFDLYKSIEDIRQMFISRFDEKDLDFEVTIRKDVPRYIHCDEQRLRQVIINLLANALKFTDRGKVCVVVNRKEDKLFICVSDSGIGIKPEYQEIVFKPFEQITENKKSKNGTGLGLAITKELVGIMGGDITLQSTYMEGSIFSFTISYKQASKKIVNAKTTKEIIFKGSKSKIILVVDDIEENRKLLMQILLNFHYQVLEATNGQEALEVLKKTKVDLVFMDMAMPILNGMDATKKVRQELKLLSLPIVMVSANVFQEDRAQALAIGANDFLAKPIEDEKLIDVLQKYLEQETVQTAKEEKYRILQAAKKLDLNEVLRILETSSLEKNVISTMRAYAQEFNFAKIQEICSND
jgi:PAS domain S-box-containing protein